MNSRRGSLSLQILILPVLLCLFFVNPSVAEQQSEALPPQKTGHQLFGTRELRGSLNAFKPWQSLVTRANQQVDGFHACRTNRDLCSPVAKSWLQMEEGGTGKPAKEQLKWVNHFFNRWPYRLDLDVYNLSDYWATPGEFMKKSGDCEDYSITKYFALRALGYPASALRIVVLKDQIRNLGHAVLSVTLESENFILDNLSDIILIDKRYTHYRPQYSLNENYRWAHIRTFKKDLISR